MRKIYRSFFSLIISLYLILRPGFCHHLRRHSFSLVPLRSLYQSNVNDKKSLRYHHINRAIFQLSACLVEQPRALNCLRLCHTAAAV